MVIKNLEDLIKIGGLEEGYIIMFGDLKYEVRTSYLSAIYQPNDIVFTLVTGDSFDKYDFCSKEYGYESESGTFPSYRERDFEAAYRVAKKIYIEILKQDHRPQLEDYTLYDKDGGVAVTRSTLMSNDRSKEFNLVDDTKCSTTLSNNVPKTPHHSISGDCSFGGYEVEDNRKIKHKRFRIMDFI